MMQGIDQFMYKMCTFSQYVYMLLSMSNNGKVGTSTPVPSSLLLLCPWVRHTPLVCDCGGGRRGCWAATSPSVCSRAAATTEVLHHQQHHSVNV